MSKDKEAVQELKPGRKKLKMTFAIIFLAALFIIELYLMMNSPDDYLLLGIVGLVMLCFVYWITDLAFQIQDERETKREMEYESIFKSEKASYLLSKMNFEEINRRMDEVKKSSGTFVDEMIQAQKALTKVTINRNKENANALMNSSEKLMDRIVELDNKLEELDHVSEEGQNGSMAEMSQEALAKQQEVIISSLHDIEFSLKDELQKAINSIQEQIHSMPTVQERVEPMMESMPDLSEMDLDSLTQELKPENIQPESMEEITQAFDMDQLDNLPIMEDSGITDTQEILEEPAAVETIAPAEQEMPVEEIETIQPEINSDPNHVMTPEEIAALLGETGGIEAAAEPEPVVEEKPPAPDLSDPGHVMTPEEIAALLANM